MVPVMLKIMTDPAILAYTVALAITLVAMLVLCTMALVQSTETRLARASLDALDGAITVVDASLPAHSADFAADERAWFRAPVQS